MEHCKHHLPFRQCAICLGLAARPEMAWERKDYVFTSTFTRDEEVNVVSVLDTIEVESEWLDGYTKEAI